jgi:hypothetical protein
MGAKVVDTSLKKSSWTSEKPSDFKGKDLENALAAAESLNGKQVSMPAKLSTVPKPKISEIEDCITQMESDITILQKALADLKSAKSKLEAVCSAASSTATELQRMGKDKKKSEDEQRKYNSAAQVAQVIGSNAAASLSKIK